MANDMEAIQIGSITEFNQAMVDASERLNDVIRVRMLERPQVWYSLFPKETYPDGAGYSQKTFTFHAGMDDLAGLTSWERIQPSRAPGTLSPDDPGYDSCSYKAKQFDYGFTEREFFGYRTARRSPTVCYNDVRYKWQFAQQLSKIFGFMTDITADVWETFCREAFMLHAQKVVLTDTADKGTFSYSPFNSTDLTLSAADFFRISKLSSRHLEFWRNLMALKPRGIAAGSDGGIPIFELVVDPFDIDEMIKKDPKYWEAFLYANPNFLLEGYGKVKAFKGWAFLYDALSPRFRLKSKSSNTVVLERVLPYVKQNVSVGVKREPNPEYIKAEYGVCFIRPKNTFKLRIPATKPANPGGGLQFGTVPSWGGEFYPINIPDIETNLLSEKCFFFARYAAFVEPLEYIDDAVMILYKRCPAISRIECSTPVSGNTSATVVSGSAEAIEPNEDGKYTTVRLTLNKALSSAAPMNVKVTFADNSTANAVIATDAQAPTYDITFASANTWISKGGGIASITVA